jgi:2-octaprenyl-6-methoxyphenol hydroxylase
MHRYDVVIVGGGLVGSSLAIALSGKDLRVLCIEAQASQIAPPSFDERKLALSTTSLNALTALNVIPLLSTAPATLRSIHISRAGEFGFIQLNANDYGRKTLGGVVLARELGEALEARLNQCSDIHRWRPARLQSLQEREQDVLLTIETAEGEQQIGARFLVGADGTLSKVRELLDIQADEHDYQQHLFVASVSAERAPGGVAYERFTSSGPVALLPMNGGVYGGLCGVGSEDVQRIAALSDMDYADYFQSRFGWRAGKIQRVGKRTHYPLRAVIARSIHSHRSVLLGNAAQTLHPIGAQGFNLGLRDALTFVDALQHSKEDAQLTQIYADWRKEDRTQTIAFSDGLARLTSNHSLIAQTLRQVGTAAVNMDAGLRAQIASGAMGFRGRVPSLAMDRAA